MGMNKTSRAHFIFVENMMREREREYDENMQEYTRT
jgi:hypothetical protein